MSLFLELRHNGPQLDFSAEIPKGQITALVGPSGSGKTSIIRAIAGLLKLKHARISLAGEAWDTERAHLPTRERSIGLVPQHHGLFPHLSVMGNVETALSHLPSQQKRHRATECIRLAQVEGLEGRHPHELSGGQRQRVALARAIARNPQVLLLDEPFSAIDRGTRKHLYLELRRLHNQLGNTVLLVTHDLDEAAQLASHLLLIDHGQLLQAGETTKVLTRPRNEQAAQLLDIPNVFSASLEKTPAGLAELRWGPHRLQIAATDRTPAGRVKFAVLPQNILLVKTDKPWGSHLENPIPTQVQDVVALGGEVLVSLQVKGLNEVQLQMRLPERALRRYPITSGSEVTVCLRSSDIILLE
ncbi:MAG TPA: ABC transporter ATP-binding protein [Malonomonas sp.]